MLDGISYEQLKNFISVFAKLQVELIPSQPEDSEANLSIFRTIDCLLEAGQVLITVQPAIVTIAYLRSTYSIRQNLKNWDSFKAAAFIELSNKFKPEKVQTLMKGL